MHYVEWHACSAYSFGRGASAPGRLAERAAGLGMGVLGVCDRQGFYGSASMRRAAQSVGLRAPVGAEVWMEDGSVLPVWIRNRAGYQGLSRLFTTMHLRSAKGEGRVRWTELAELGESAGKDLVVLTGGEEGPLLRAWAQGGNGAMGAALERLRKIFPEKSLRVEIQRQGRREERRWNRALIDLAAHRKLPLLATNGVLYADREARAVADVFTCLREHTHLDAAGRLLSAHAERHLKDTRSMRHLFRDCPEAIRHTVELAEEVTFDLKDLGYAFPRYPVPEGETMDSFLRKIVWFGAEQRYGGLAPPVRRQLEKELELIARLGFSGYFLIVWDIVNYCREAGILAQGRGSAANSAVCYSLGITAVDPVGGKLLFERFLSEGRRSWPDIDIDLPSGERREQVIQEVYRRYGPRGAAMTANIITFRGRGAAREIGKALNFPPDILKRMSDLFSRGDFPHTLELQAQMEQAGLSKAHPRAGAFLELYPKIHGLPRHLGQHSGGMIICEGALDAVVPLENARMAGRVVAQWDKEDCEDLGIIKVDLLGLGMMAALQDSVELTQARGHPVDLGRIPKDDPATFALMNAADTIGVFQIESRAQMATLPRLKPKVFYDLVVEVAIVRPGPIVGRLAHPYLERRAGRAPLTYIHEDVRPVLERTLGVPLFQEQVLKMAMVLADFSGSEAEELRKAMSFHRSAERMQRVRAKLRAAMTARGHAEAVITEVEEAIGSFALYGFPESHAISFALIAYASAYLKTHYPAEFYTGLLNNQPMGFYSPATLIQDARRRGLRFLPPCLRESAGICTIIDDQTIRLGLRMVTGVGAAALERCLDARMRRPFRSMEDFRERTDFARDERRALARSGALDTLAGSRRRALWAVEAPLRTGELFPREEDLGGTGPADVLPEMDAVEVLRADFEETGLTTGAHPMARVRPQLPAHVRPAVALNDIADGRTVCVAGAVICRQRPGTAKGVVFVSLEDETGIANCIVYPKLFEKMRLCIVQEPFLRIIGRLQRAEGVTHVKAWRIEPLFAEDLPAGASHDFH